MSENLKSRHAFGSEEKVQSALEQGLIDAYDILFLDGDTDKPKVGWIDKDGKVVIVTDEKADLSEVEAGLVEVNAEVDAVGAKVDGLDSEVEGLDAKVATKADNAEVEVSYEKVKYEITSKPVGTLVNYGDREIRVMCPANTEWAKQNVGTNGNANMYYIGFKAYAPSDDIVSFKEDLAGVINDQTMYYFEDNEFAGVDEFGRKYSIVWLPVAAYDSESSTWTYYGKNSTTSKYIGWTYVVEWYNADGLVVASGSIRVNLSNEECHSSVEPYYVNNTLADANAYTDEQIANAIGIEVIEF